MFSCNLSFKEFGIDNFLIITFESTRGSSSGSAKCLLLMQGMGTFFVEI